MAIVATYSTWAVISGYLNCVPVAKFWDKTISGYCLSFEAVWFFNASMNIATDVTLLLLPMPLLSQLQLPRMQKLALMGVFAIGILYVTHLCPLPLDLVLTLYPVSLSPVSSVFPVFVPSLAAPTHHTPTSAPPTGPQQSATSPSSAPVFPSFDQSSAECSPSCYPQTATTTATPATIVPAQTDSPAAARHDNRANFSAKPTSETTMSTLSMLSRETGPARVPWVALRSLLR